MRGDISFDEAYEVWFQKHFKVSAGDRRQLLERRSPNAGSDNECAETRFLRDVWWPVYGELEMLSPEYEVVDGLGKTRFLDHAIIHYPMLVDLEVDGYGTHQRDASRYRFADDRRRDAGLRMAGWDVLRIAYSDITEHPLACQQLLRRWMDRYAAIPRERVWTEHVIRLGLYHGTFTLAEVKRVLDISDHPARALLRHLMETGVIESAGKGSRRVHAYRLSDKYSKVNVVSKILFRD